MLVGPVRKISFTLPFLKSFLIVINNSRESVPSGYLVKIHIGTLWKLFIVSEFLAEMSQFLLIHGWQSRNFHYDMRQTRISELNVRIGSFDSVNGNFLVDIDFADVV